MNHFSCSLALVMATFSTYALAAESRKSPYFIDGIHCEGLEGLLDEGPIVNSYSDKVVADVGIKVVRQNQCEGVFSRNGVEKFQWVTPGDLEKLSFTLIHSHMFKTVDIRIEKSELQNHVHLIGNFKMYEPKNFYSVNLGHSVENAGNAGNAGNRLTTKADGTVEFNKRGPNNPAHNSLGFKYINSTARNPLGANDLRHGNKDVTMTEDEKAAQARPNGQYGAVNYQTNFPYGASWGGSSFVRIGLESTRLSGDERSTLDSNIEYGGAFQYDPLIPAVYRLSLLYSSYSATGSELETEDKKSSNKNSRSMVFAGFAQDFRSQRLNSNMRLYRSISPELHFFGDLDLMFKLGEYAGLNHGLGFAGNLVRGALLPEQRFGLPDANKSQFYYRAEKAISAFGVENQVSLKVGYSGYYANNNLETQYSRNQVFGELGWKTHTDNFDLGLSFLYGNQRLY